MWDWLGPLRYSRWPRHFKPTREGYWFSAFTLGVGAAAIASSNNLLYLILGMLISMIVASSLLSEMSLRGLLVTRQIPPRIFAERPFLMGIGLHNGKGRLPSFSIEVEDQIQGRPLDKKCYFLKVPPGRTQHTSYRHQFTRRGRYVLIGFRVGTKFPFAFFRKWRRIEAPGELIVYPALLPSLPPDVALDAGPGEEAAGRLGRRGEFHGLHEWRDGDDWRDIHWRTTARTGRVMVREHEEEAVPALTIVVDNARPPDAPDDARDDDEMERAVRVAASLAVRYVGRGFSVGLALRGGGVPAGSGEPHLARVLRALALCEWAEPGVALALPAGPRSRFVHARRGQVHP